MVTLLLKKDAPINTVDFRPISLIHSFAELSAKVMSMCLAAHIDHLISLAQSAVMKSKCIHDNFVTSHDCCTAERWPIIGVTQYTVYIEKTTQVH